ncbi:hypothetical protein QBC38DRAFT_483721 [Podospora fimiseda]|uniref:C2H2-type domain-containing protein n=1 Tax=Podospora fimiseda TaxID=252190 RepID=A0AAN7GYI7_9PEZI|nr:hypothetical protein QBC38DRAFT_483721 [Podospora fimiseda]
MQAMHGSASYPCPHDTCPAHTHNFKRKDKLQEHIRMKHADLLAKCIHAHCTAKTSHLLYHRQEDHGAYECTLDHCGGAARSYFTESKLDKHLRDHHKMSRGVCKTVMDVLEKMSEKTVHDRHLPTSTRVKRWVNCTVCPSVIQQAQVGQMAALGAADVEGQYYQ